MQKYIIEGIILNREVKKALSVVLFEYGPLGSERANYGNTWGWRVEFGPSGIANTACFQVNSQLFLCISVILQFVVMFQAF